MSLKDILLNKLKEKGYLSYGELATICVEEGYKVSTGERRLRRDKNNPLPKEVKHIEAKSKRNTTYICAYSWNEEKPIEIKLMENNFARQQINQGFFSYPKVLPQYAKERFNDPV